MSKQPRGPITTLLDLTDRDAQENDLFPLISQVSWFTRDRARKTVAFTPQVQLNLYRGPAAFGQRFSFDIGSIHIGDLLLGAVLQVQLGHWLEEGYLAALRCGLYTYADVTTAWEYANSLGTCLIETAELEIDGVTVETIDGDFINVFNTLFHDYNAQVGIEYDHIGRLPITYLRQIGVPGNQLLPSPRNFPTEDGYVHCPLPFFFGRVRYQEALPLVSIKEGLCRIHITLRPFSQLVRQIRGYRDSCDSVPLQTPFTFNVRGKPPVTATTSNAVPSIKSVALLTHGAIVDGEFRQGLLRKPFEMLHREVQTFSFDEPMKYVINKTSDAVTIQLPLEANHPVEEIIWYVRRKGTGINNEWTNYSDRLEQEWQTDSKFATRPLVQSATVQVNGIRIIEADEQYFRQHIAKKHRGGYAAYSNYIYGYSFAETPGEHEPTGSINASRANSLRLTLTVRPPGGALDPTWEVKVFCIALNWMRYENGLANAIFED
jgi:Large eukaryotic DNA virus major capsid protein/Major capsid protein N-terminus